MTDRAERRAERERIRAKRLRRLPWLFRPPLARNPRSVGMAIKTPTICSCEQCGNPRRYFGDRTIQERRHGWC